MNEYDMVECPSVGGFPPTRYEIQVRQKGKWIIAIFRIWIEGWGDIVVRARVSIRKIQQILFRKYQGEISGYSDPYVIEGFFDSIVKGAKDIAKKVARSKVFKVARKVISHPAVVAVSSIIPGLNAVVPAAAMIEKGLSMAEALDKARRGSKPDMHTIKKAIHLAKKGKGEKAIRAAKLLRMADSMAITPPVSKQVAPAAAAIAQKTGAPAEVVKAAVEKAVKVDVPKPPPVAKPKPKRRRRQKVRRRKLTAQQRRKVQTKLRQRSQRWKKARAIRQQRGAWPSGFDPRRELMQMNYLALLARGYQPTAPPTVYPAPVSPTYQPTYLPTPQPVPTPTRFQVPPGGALPPQPYTAARPPWTPSYPNY